MDQFVYNYLEFLIDPFINTRKRVFVGYLGTALLFALIFYLIATKSTLRQAFCCLFARAIWFSKSSRADCKILLINQAIMMGLLPRMISRLAIATFLFESMHIWFDGRAILWPLAPGWVISTMFTISLFILDDFAKYLVHRALHRFSFLWHFHKVHHSAETLTPLTVYRTHPLEGVIFALRSVFVQAVMVTLFIYFFGDRAELVTVLGANAILFLFNTTGSNLRHSHVWISYGRIFEHLLISPAQHQIHHSIEARHYDRNFGAVLAIWDWIGGSLCLAQKGESIRFGLGDGSISCHNLKTLYWKPCIDAVRSLTPLIAIGTLKMRSRSIITRRTVAGLKYYIFLGIAATSISPAYGQKNPQELNIYSHRQPFLIKPFIEAYKQKYGTKINIVFASKGLAQRLQAEGPRSPADVILTVDMARLNVYADKKLLAIIDSPILRANIPAHLRDPENRWFALSKRARIIVAAKRADDADKMKNYEDLADPVWKGRICARPGSHVYNRALVASIIEASGLKAAQAWATSVVLNLARRPQGNDRAQVKAIYEGVCDFAIINNYYYGKLKYSEKVAQIKWANAVKIIFPNQLNRGTHVNISGGGVAKYAKNKAEAVKFLEFLTSQTAQHLYGSVNFEYPVNPTVAPKGELASWGTFKEDKMPISRIADLAPDAQKVIDRVGW